MSDALHDLRLVQPGTVDEAIAALLRAPGGRFVAGGTDLIVNMRRGIAQPERLIDLSGIDELKATDVRRDGVTIGAGVTHRDARPRRRDRIALSGAGAGGRGDRRARAIATLGDGRRQSLPRHALHLLQPERMVAQRQRLLPEEPRRHLPRRAAGRALPRRLQRRSRAGAARARRRGRDRRAERRAGAFRSASCMSRTAARISRSRRAKSSSRCICRRDAPPSAYRKGARARRDRLSARRRRGGAGDGRGATSRGCASR